MYLYFTIFGFIFVAIFATVTNYLYDMFPINKITNFFKPLGKGYWYKINSLVLPTILWGFIELPILGNLSLFWVSILLNVCVSSAVIYVIKYGYYLIVNDEIENNLINLLSIYVASFIGFVIAYLVFMISSIGGYYLLSILAVIILFVLYVLISLFPPKSDFFEK